MASVVTHEPSLPSVALAPLLQNQQDMGLHYLLPLVELSVSNLIGNPNALCPAFSQESSLLLVRNAFLVDGSWIAF